MTEREKTQYEILAEGVDEMRETVRAMVAGLMADGFDEEQARVIVAGFFTALTKHKPGESDG